MYWSFIIPLIVSLLQSNLVNTDTERAIDLLQVDLTSLASEVSFFRPRSGRPSDEVLTKDFFEKSKGGIESVPINGVSVLSGLNLEKI